MSTLLNIVPHSLAIVIPSKDRQSDIERCLVSINKQPTRPDQLIVIDQSQKPYHLDSFPQVLHIHCPDLSGLTAAKNRALQFIHSEYVLFLDDDIEMLEDCVPALKAEFLRHPDAAAIGCSMGERGRVSILGTLRQAVFDHGFFNRRRIMRPNGVELRTLSGGGAAIRLTVLDEERFDEALVGVGYGEDFEYSVRAKNHGRLWLCRSARAYHHASPVNRLAAQKQRRNIWNHFLYFYDKFDAGRDGWNRLWLVFWMMGQSILWVRLGMGLPPIRDELRQRLTGKNPESLPGDLRNRSSAPAAREAQSALPKRH